ncbi:MAG TPA: DNA mismatch repair protein MutS [Nitrospiraceae bacterium]|nr:DNA mismatch repair protein MutS [Nitrospiraceae bacterium]
MKKRKKTEPTRPDFDHRPFKDLRGLVREKPSAEKKPQKVVRPSLPEDIDDDELFLRSGGDVKRTGTRPVAKRTGKRTATTKPGGAEKAEEKDRDLFLQELTKLGPSFREQAPAVDEEELHHASAAGRMRQLKRGTISISEELDLHGMPKDEALHRLGHFISSASMRGRKAVLVITGKGINSPDGPVLQGAVAAWLREQGKGMVAEFHPAPREKGGSGAYVVFLRMQK